MTKETTLHVPASTLRQVLNEVMVGLTRAEEGATLELRALFTHMLEQLPAGEMVVSDQKYNEIYLAAKKAAKEETSGFSQAAAADDGIEYVTMDHDTIAAAVFAIAYGRYLSEGRGGGFAGPGSRAR